MRKILVYEPILLIYIGTLKKVQHKAYLPLGDTRLFEEMMVNIRNLSGVRVMSIEQVCKWKMLVLLTVVT